MTNSSPVLPMAVSIAGALGVAASVVAQAPGSGAPCKFPNAVAYPAGDGPRSVAIGDLDGDMDLDLVVAHPRGNADAISILLNEGDGSFAVGIQYPAGEGPISVAIGDLDGDGDLDLAVTNTNDKVTVLLNSCELCQADIDGDGIVGISDLLELLAQWGTDPGGPPDIDGDGIVGIIDLLQLLAGWGPCRR